MKKLYPILLIAILLFNWFGYQLLSSYLEDKADARLETAIDNHDYDDSDLVSIRIPVSYLPYYNNSSTFERVYGQVEIQGQEYRYVKRRIFNDSLELLCIPNPAVTKLNAVRDEFFRFLNDLQHAGTEKNTHSHHGSTKPNSIDYYTAMNLYQLNPLFVSLAPVSSHYYFRASLRHKQLVEQPPDIT